MLTAVLAKALQQIVSKCYCNILIRMITRPVLNCICELGNRLTKENLLYEDKSLLLQYA